MDVFPFVAKQSEEWMGFCSWAQKILSEGNFNNCIDFLYKLEEAFVQDEPDKPLSVSVKEAVRIFDDTPENYRTILATKLPQGYIKCAEALTPNMTEKQRDTIIELYEFYNPELLQNLDESALTLLTEFMKLEKQQSQSRDILRQHLKTVDQPNESTNEVERQEELIILQAAKEIKKISEALDTKTRRSEAFQDFHTYLSNKIASILDDYCELSLHSRVKFDTEERSDEILQNEKTNPVRYEAAPVHSWNAKESTITIITGTNSSGKSHLLDILCQHERSSYNPSHTEYLLSRTPAIVQEYHALFDIHLPYFVKGDGDGTHVITDSKPPPHRRFQFFRSSPFQSPFKDPLIAKMLEDDTIDPPDEVDSKLWVDLRGGRHELAPDNESSHVEASDFGRMSAVSDLKALHAAIRGKMLGITANTQPLGTFQKQLERLATVMKLVSEGFFEIFGQSLMLLIFTGTSTAKQITHFIVHARQEAPRIALFSDVRQLGTLAKYIGLSNELQCEGGGMRSAVAMLLHMGLAQLDRNNPRIFLLDEPEVFLHPEQCRRLAKQVCKLLPDNQHLVVSTHSSDFIFNIALKALGCDVNKKTKFLRLQRNENALVNEPVVRICAADPDSLFGANVNLRSRGFALYTGIIDGLFHEHVVLTESFNDAFVYESLWRSAGTITKDPRFTCGPKFIPMGSRDKYQQVCEFYRSAGVQFTIILDIDALQRLGNENKLTPTIKPFTEWQENCRDILSPLFLDESQTMLPTDVRKALTLLRKSSHFKGEQSKDYSDVQKWINEQRQATKNFYEDYENKNTGNSNAAVLRMFQNLEEDQQNVLRKLDQACPWFLVVWEGALENILKSLPLMDGVKFSTKFTGADQDAVQQALDDIEDAAPDDSGIKDRFRTSSAFGLLERINKAFSKPQTSYADDNKNRKLIELKFISMDLYQEIKES